MKVVFIFLRVILSLILIISLVSFIALQAVSEKVDENVVEETILEVASEVVDNKIIDSSKEIDSFDFDDLYSNLTLRCLGEEKVILEEANLTLSCDEVRDAGNGDGLKEILRDKLQNKIEENIQEDILDENFENLDGWLLKISQGVFVLGLISAVCILLIIFLSVPKYEAAINLGVVGLIAGSPFFLSNSISFFAEKTGLDSIILLANEISSVLFVQYLITFFFGGILLFIGILAKGKKRK